MEVKKGYDIEEVVDVIEMLADSQGFYGRLLEEILYIEENEPDKYEVFKGFIEKQEFKNPVEVVLFFEGQVESDTWTLLFYSRSINYYTRIMFVSHRFVTQTIPIMERDYYWEVITMKNETFKRVLGTIGKIAVAGVFLSLPRVTKVTYIREDSCSTVGYYDAVRAIMNTSMFASDKRACVAAMKRDAESDYYRAVIEIAQCEMFASDKLATIKTL